MNGVNLCEDEIAALEFGVPIQTKINPSGALSEVRRFEMEDTTDEI